MQQLHRHRVEHLVSEDDPFDRLRQCVVPAHARCVRGERRALPLAQRGRQLDDVVRAHPIAQRIEELPRKRPRAGAEFPHRVAAAAVERLRRLARQRAAEERDSSGAVTKSLPEAGSMPNWRLSRA
jgi:hypothetical protein